MIGVSGRFLLDTNIVIAILNREAAVTEHLRDTTVFLSSVVLGELYFGARKSAKSKENLQLIDGVIRNYPVLVCDAEIARHYGEVKHHLRTKGRPIPENDIWIAALAKQHDLTLVSRDEHFGEVSDLRVEAW